MGVGFTSIFLFPSLSLCLVDEFVCFARSPFIKGLIDFFFYRECKGQPMLPTKLIMSAGIREAKWWEQEVAFVVAQSG